MESTEKKMPMNKANQNYQKKESTPFMKIKDASRVTGLSMYYLRNGCKVCTVTCIKSGMLYLVNVHRLLEKLDTADIEVVQ